MNKRRLLHHRTLWQEALLSSLLALGMGLPLLGIYLYSATGRLPSLAKFAEIFLLLVLVGSGQGLINWYKKTR